MRFCELLGMLVGAAVMLSGSALLGKSGHAGNTLWDSRWSLIIMITGLLFAAYSGGLFSSEKTRRRKK